MPLTVHDLWQEYREQCCPPELGESSELIYLQEQIFKAAVTATIGNIIERPSCFHELRESIVAWIATREAERN